MALRSDGPGSGKNQKLVLSLLRKKTLTAEDAVWLLHEVKSAMRINGILSRRLYAIEGRHDRAMQKLTDSHIEEMKGMYEQVAKIKKEYEDYTNVLSKQNEDHAARYDKMIAESHALNDQLMTELCQARYSSPFSVVFGKKSPPS